MLNVMFPPAFKPQTDGEMDMEGSNRELIDPMMVWTEVDVLTRRHRLLQFVPLPFEAAGAH